MAYVLIIFFQRTSAFRLEARFGADSLQRLVLPIIRFFQLAGR